VLLPLEDRGRFTMRTLKQISQAFAFARVKQQDKYIVPVHPAERIDSYHSFRVRSARVEVCWSARAERQEKEVEVM